MSIPIISLDQIILLMELGILAIVVAAMLAPLETMGWWAGWWYSEEEEDDVLQGLRADDVPDTIEAHAATTSHFVVFLTGIGGSTAEVNVPMEKQFLVRLRERLPTAEVIDTIYPYSVANKPLVEDRVLAAFWRWALAGKVEGRRVQGFVINLRNLFQVLVAADHRYGPFFSRGTAEVILDKLKEKGYTLESNIPITIIGYSGGGQVSACVAPYLAQLIPAPVQVISLGGVVNSNPLIERLDKLTHIWGERDTVQRLGTRFFPGRWRFMWFSGWNKARRAGRIGDIRLPNMTHDGPGGYLDEKKTFADGRTHMQVTVETIATLIETPVHPIPDD